MKYFAAALSLVALCACSKSSPAPSASGTPATAAPAPVKPVPAELPDVLARVNGEVINKADLTRAVQAMEQRAGQQVPAEQRDRVLRGLLDEIIGLKILQQEANARKIEITDAELDRNIDVVKQHFGGPDVFNQALEAQKITLEQFREQTRAELRVGKMLETEVNSKVSVQPKDLDEFYAKNPDQFKEPEQARASHILIAVAEGTDAKTKEAARAKAESILKQIRSGADFADLAKKHSEDPGNAQAGGDIGYFTRNRMVPPFEKAVWSLQPGEVSDVVETQYGFHIIKLADRQEARTVTLDDVRPQVEQFLKDKQRQEKTQAFIQTLKAKGKVEVLI